MKVGKGAATLKRKNKGFTLIELMVVVAIFGILTAAVGTSVSAIFSSQNRKCASSIDALLSQCRVLALSGAEDPVLRLTLEADGYYGTIYTGATQRSRQRLGSEGMSVTFTVNGVEYSLSEQNLRLAFDRESGALLNLDEVTGNSLSGSCTDIRVGGYTIEITPSTGYHRMSG
ncbi:MAG: type II secretion system protein [Lawsonibacter sp.]|nr:type II secretion system protein [Lawsonibacter sp.]